MLLFDYKSRPVIHFLVQTAQVYNTADFVTVWHVAIGPAQGQEMQAACSYFMELAPDTSKWV